MNARRLHSLTYDVPLPLHNGFHNLKLTVAFDGDGRAHEVAYVSRGKSGLGLDQLLIELAIATSRALQGRDPQTGQPITEAISNT